jgi:hypothetical protein
MFKKIAPKCYLTIFGFIVAAVLFASSDDKRSVDQFHLRQSFGLYATGLLFYFVYKILGTELVSADLSSLIVLIPLMILWFLGFKAAILNIDSHVFEVPLISKQLKLKIRGGCKRKPLKIRGLKNIVHPSRANRPPVTSRYRK